MNRRAMPLLCALVLVAGPAIGSPQGQAKNLPGPILTASLSLERTKVRANEAVTVHFGLTSASSASVVVLKRGTPLDVLNGRHFEVRRDGKPVLYIGRLVKRQSPYKPDYVTLPPGGSVTADFDLAAGYALAEPGIYTVSLASTARALASNDWVERAVPLIADPVTFELTEPRPPLPGIPPPPPQSVPEGAERERPMAPATFVGCTDAWKTGVEQARLDALRLAADGQKAVGAWPLLSDRYSEWFGAKTDARSVAVATSYRRIYDALHNRPVTFYCGCDDEGDSLTTAVTYVLPNQPYGIHVCSYGMAPRKGTDSLPGALIHAVSSFYVVAGTGDHAYGQNESLRLALTDPDAAIVSADNLEYFAENDLPTERELVVRALSVLLALVALASLFPIIRALRSRRAVRPA